MYIIGLYFSTTSPVYIVILSLLRGTYVYSEGGGYHNFFLPFFFLLKQGDSVRGVPPTISNSVRNLF
jgi:hypothetical protein